MVTFDSPFDRCPVCREYVLLDQTQEECAREHGCENIECPLKRYFEGIAFETGVQGRESGKRADQVSRREIP